MASLGVACSSDDDPNASSSGSGGTSAGGSAPGGGGMSAGSGGVSSTSGGAGGSAGSSSSGGTSGAGGGGGASGSGQSGGSGTSGGAGGESGTGGNDAGTTAAKPSAGCNLGTGRPAGGSVTVAQDHYFTFPASYDGTKPFPVLVGFHGCASVNRGTDLDSTEWINLTRGTSFETEYVRAVPVSSDQGGCWNYDNDIGRVVDMYDELVANYCVDTGRVFATGHSSGAQFVVQVLLTRHASDAQHLSFKGVAPVAASDYGAMTGPIPVMYIQGKMDAERGNGDGHETVARFRTANACNDSSTPYTQVMGCQSRGGGVSVNPGCVAYDGCTAPTIWCSHDDPDYSGTMHGVPCFGIKAMYDFFESLP
jgi:polyhydroxybutyrate depolymerase